MQIEKITSANEHLFYSYVKGRELEFFFFIMDYKQYPQKTQLFIATNEKSQVKGVFIIWSEHIIQLRGSPPAAEAFILFLQQEKVEINQITGTTAHKDLLEQYFPTPQMKFNMYRMTLEKGQEILQEKYPFIELDDSHKEAIAAFLRKCDPVFWGHQKAEKIMMDKNRPFFAIQEDRKILSLAGLWIDEIMGIINIVATDPDYRKQQRATSMVSTSVKWLFQRTDQILIHVRTENVPAISTYTKVGYQINYEYIVVTLKQ